MTPLGGWGESSYHVEELRPDLTLMGSEQVLVQAWKKTSSYIRYHNWYSDTLELDRASLNLPDFISSLSSRIRDAENWSPRSLRIVPAPKSQAWRVKGRQWGPVESKKLRSKLRPLAHVDLGDQVLATALMMCVADRVETLQGDPKAAITLGDEAPRVVSYGNRLFCDSQGAALRHRWGSSKLYRAYFQDYRSFLSRPKDTGLGISMLSNAVVVQSDLSQFYDRVRPNVLAAKLTQLRHSDDDPAYYEFARTLLDWRWSDRDAVEVDRYAKACEIQSFSRVCLPQGLVAAGFFANVVLLDFDGAIRAQVGSEIFPGVWLRDACRYVDDLRLVLEMEQCGSLDELEERSSSWIQSILDSTAEGLQVSRKKTTAALLHGGDRPLVRQSRKMERVQTALSGGFDARGGEEILDAVQGLLRSQRRYSDSRLTQDGFALSPVPDVRDATVARFAAGRYRTTYRSLRPLLGEVEDSEPIYRSGNDEEPALPLRSRQDLDDEAKAFALGLIENWVEDPSNVRLLRIALDIWPDREVLQEVLVLLQPYLHSGNGRGASHRVASYCMSEILRAGATETGFVNDAEALPEGVDLAGYREVLAAEARKLLERGGKTPWYLRHQAMLYLATVRSYETLSRHPEADHYAQLFRVLSGEKRVTPSTAWMAAWAKRAVGDSTRAIQLVASSGSVDVLEQIARRDPSFALEVLAVHPSLGKHLSSRIRRDLLVDKVVARKPWTTLSKSVLGKKASPIRNEIGILSFALSFLKEVSTREEDLTITPSDVLIAFGSGDKRAVSRIQIRGSAKRSSDKSLYSAPSWLPRSQHWRYQLASLIRFILVGSPDYLKPRTYSPRENSPYRAPASHWLQRRYGLFNGHAAFEDDSLPISHHTEELLFSLFRWPGCPTFRSEPFSCIEDAIGWVERRLGQVKSDKGEASGLLMLRLCAPRLNTQKARPLRACVVQTAIPHPDDFSNDITVSGAAMRRKHRRHLSTALEAVRAMLALRETHRNRDGRLDWLILPELSVHPDDVAAHLVPFARQYRTVILAGLTYHSPHGDGPLINSALWVVPTATPGGGLAVVTRKQGKWHLAPEESLLNRPVERIVPYRPSQWLIGYEWAPGEDPLWLTAAVCYDATDLRLAADLRSRSDVFAIPALNHDVGTFDQMAQALHYHMFQLVVIANTGLYGGSNAHMPVRKPYLRQVFHLHGQPQASIAFFEIDNVGAFKRRSVQDVPVPQPQNPAAVLNFKWPPAGLRREA